MIARYLRLLTKLNHEQALNVCHTNVFPSISRLIKLLLLTTSLHMIARLATVSSFVWFTSLKFYDGSFTSLIIWTAKRKTNVSSADWIDFMAGRLKWKCKLKLAEKICWCGKFAQWNCFGAGTDSTFVCFLHSIKKAKREKSSIEWQGAEENFVQSIFEGIQFTLEHKLEHRKSNSPQMLQLEVELLKAPGWLGYGVKERFGFTWK